MKTKFRILVFLVSLLVIAVTITSCQNNTDSNDNSIDSATSSEEEQNFNTGESDILIAYFSCTNTTKSIAESIKNVTNGDIYRITPSQPYTSEDLNYNNNSSRANKEQNDPSSRPKIEGKIEQMSAYNTVFIGFPIWWGKLPKIIYTFLEAYDLSGKTVVPFCTSGSSGITTAVNEIKTEQPSANVVGGKRFASGATQSEVTGWVESLNIKIDREIKKVKVYCNDKSLEIILADNSSAKAFAEKLKEGDITITMNDYGDFEKVGSLGFSLPQNNHQITTSPGDVILYQGTSITIYYDVNSWNFTLLGKIGNMTRSSMLDFFGGKGKVTVKFSLK